MANPDIDLMAHLMRRAGFGATRDELEALVDKGYEAAVEELLAPDSVEAMPDDIIRRYHVDQSELRIQGAGAANWLYKMISTSAPLPEKTALFWHSLFAAGERKVNNLMTMVSQVDRFRRHGLGSFRTLLVELSSEPAMLYWLDNNENHKVAVNENYGRELLELFSMGIGNYTEQDVKECARAFTGWTVEAAEYMTLRSTKASIWPYGRVAFQFEYRPDDHDESEKEFLGERGAFDGRDIIDIIVRQPATARFVAKRLFLFFAADEIDERGERVVDDMARTYFDSDFEIRAMLRTLFLSDYFRSEAARFARVKSPVELVAGRTQGYPGVPVAQAGDLGRVAGHRVHGPGAAQPSLGRGMARGFGVDRLRLHGGEDQLRGRPSGKRRQPRRPVLHRQAPADERPVDDPRPGRRPLPRHTRACPGIGGHERGPGRACGEERRRRSQR